MRLASTLVGVSTAAAMISLGALVVSIERCSAATRRIGFAALAARS